MELLLYFSFKKSVVHKWVYQWTLSPLWLKILLPILAPQPHTTIAHSFQELLKESTEIASLKQKQNVSHIAGLLPFHKS